MDFTRSSTATMRFTCRPASSAFKSAVDGSPAGGSPPSVSRLLSITSMDFTRASTAATLVTCNPASSAFKSAVDGSPAEDSPPSVSRLLSITSIDFIRSSTAATRFTCRPVSSAFKSAVETYPSGVNISSPSVSRVFSTACKDFTRPSNAATRFTCNPKSSAFKSPMKSRGRTGESSTRNSPANLATSSHRSICTSSSHPCNFTGYSIPSRGLPTAKSFGDPRFTEKSVCVPSLTAFFVTIGSSHIVATHPPGVSFKTLPVARCVSTKTSSKTIKRSESAI